MNERIMDIAIKVATQLDWDFPSDPKEYTFSPDAVEKFAELIVRECLSMMENCDGDLDFAIWNTKKHFGVEA